jgi:hypothetical protein
MLSRKIFSRSFETHIHSIRELPDKKSFDLLPSKETLGQCKLRKRELVFFEESRSYP